MKNPPSPTMHRLLAELDWQQEGDEALELLRELLRFDTTNPPGNEAACAEHLADFLRDGGLEPEILRPAPGRANVVTRLRGDGSQPPLLLNAHLDVVPADPERWSHPPFAAEIHDGYLYGRGAIDMKNMAAMSAVVMRLARRTGLPLRRDLIFAAVADEEVGCGQGSGWLVDHHPDKVRAEYALGELGGYSLHLNGRTLYPIQVAEKGLCWLRARVEGTPGHGSIPREDNAVVRLAEALARIGRTRLPMHVGAAVDRFVREMAAAQPLPARAVLPLILKKRLSPLVIDNLVPDPSVRRVFHALVRNTVTPTVARAGAKTNVIPGRAEAELDGRIALGSSEQELLAELRAVAGPDVRFEVIESGPPVETSPDTELFALLSRVVSDHDPGAVAIPYVIPGFTDARSWSRLGTRCYGFSPVRFDPRHDVKFADLYHGDDERIPVEGFHFGLRMLADAVFRFCGR